MPANPAEPLFRLRTQNDEVEQVFELALGDHRLGSDRSNSLILPESSVSREHAVLRVDEDGLWIEDLGSTNGTFVGGRRIHNVQVPDGTELRFGRVGMVVERIEAGDAHLAIDLVWGDQAAVDSLPGQVEDTGLDLAMASRTGRLGTSLLLSDAGAVEAWLDRLEQFLDALGSGPGGLGVALADLGEALEVEGCCAVQWPHGGPAVALSTWGELGRAPSWPEIESHLEAEFPLRAGHARAGAALLDVNPTPTATNTTSPEGAVLGAPRPRVHSVRGGSGGRRSGDKSSTKGAASSTPPLALTVAVAAHGAGEPVGLVIWGEFQGRARALPYLRVLARAVSHAGRIPGSRRQGSGESRAGLGPELGQRDTEPNRAEGLRFPEGYRPGRSAPMLELYGQMGRLLRGDLSVLISGETGAGKELVASILHRSSDRREGPFVAINCAAIPRELLEAELFGVARRVATGVDPRQGKLEQANGGTLFLDELGEMAPELQAKLLRALQEREVQPVGGTPRAVDIRVLAATNVDLQRRLKDGSLRPDLFYRLAGFVLEIPALRQCREDIPGLVEYFLRRFAAQYGVQPRGVTVAALQELTAYGWPGNIRELENQVRRLVLTMGEGQVLRREHVRRQLRQGGSQDPEDALDRLIDSRSNLEMAPLILGLEERLIRRALARAGGVKLEACRLLGLSRNGLDKKMRRLGISNTEGGAASDQGLQ